MDFQNLEIPGFEEQILGFGQDIGPNHENRRFYRFWTDFWTKLQGFGQICRIWPNLNIQNVELYPNSDLIEDFTATIHDFDVFSTKTRKKRALRVYILIYMAFYGPKIPMWHKFESGFANFKAILALPSTLFMCNRLKVH